MRERESDAAFLAGASLSYPRAVVYVYHKGCMGCENEQSEAASDDFAHFVAFAQARRADLRWYLRRTELAPEYHKRATEIAGTEYYPAVCEIIMARGDSTGAVHQRAVSMSFRELCNQIKSGVTLSDIFA